MIKISESIVIYHNKKEQIQKAINSFLNTDLKVKLYLIDHSSSNDLKELIWLHYFIQRILNNSLLKLNMKR